MIHRAWPKLRLWFFLVAGISVIAAFGSRYLIPHNANFAVFANFAAVVTVFLTLILEALFGQRRRK